MTLVDRLMDKLHNTQTTLVARTLGKGKGKEVVEDSVRATHTRQLLVSKFLLLPAA